jgi:hypothetical protein
MRPPHIGHKISLPFGLFGGEGDMILHLMMTAVLAATPAQTDAAALAHRLVADQAGGNDYVSGYDQAALSGFDRLTAKYPMPDVPGHRLALQAALTASASDILHGEDQISDLYAEVLTPAELSAWSAWLESPLGRSVEAKRRAVGWPLAQPDLTPEEARAQTDFNDSPEGKAIIAKNGELIGKGAVISGALSAEIGERAQRIYCQTHECQANPRQ